jgi:Domain of unknown function (DUF6487)
MAKCPYCDNEMKRGLIESSRGTPLIWRETKVESTKIKNISKTFIQRITKRDCIVLEEPGAFKSASVIASYCDTCRKIIISNVR